MDESYFDLISKSENPPALAKPNRSQQKLPSTIRVFSDVNDSFSTLSGVHEKLREILSKSSENEPTEEEAKLLAGMIDGVIAKLSAIRGDLTI
jgi:hypothetical protein